MNKLRDLWLDFEIFIEDKAWLKWLLIGIMLLLFIFIGLKVKSNLTGEELVDDTEQLAEEDLGEETAINKEDLTPLDEEVVHILENPEDYEEEEVGKAFNESVISLDHPFVEDHLFLGEELEDGVYVYYEKVSEDYKEILSLVMDIEKLGVPIKIYTPHRDQSIANISNYTEVIYNKEIDVIGVVVREGEVSEKYNNKEEWKKYLRRVKHENQ